MVERKLVEEKSKLFTELLFKFCISVFVHGFLLNLIAFGLFHFPVTFFHVVALGLIKYYIAEEIYPAVRSKKHG
jgi:hypothetical protein